MVILQLQNDLHCKFQNSVALLLYVLAMVRRRRRRRSTHKTGGKTIRAAMTSTNVTKHLCFQTL
jgi:hypothetical protein